MENKPSKTPKRKPPPFWLLPLLFTPSLVIILAAAYPKGPNGGLQGIFNGLISIPIAIFMCIPIAGVLATYRGETTFLDDLMFFIMLAVVNLATGFAGCTMVVH